MKLSRAYLLTLGLLFSNQLTSYACSVCFLGDENQTAVQGVRWAIIALLITLALLFGIFIKFFMGIAKRSKVLQ